MIRFENTIALGSVLHLLVLISVIAGCYCGAMKSMRRIEGKQDALLKGWRDVVPRKTNDI